MLKMFRKALSNRKGFTLVELLVVVAIIGVLAAIAIPKFTDASATSRGAKLQADLRTIDSASQLYYASAGGYTALGALSPALLATIPVPPVGEIKIKGIQVTANGGGAYSVNASGRALYNNSTVDNMPQ